MYDREYTPERIEELRPNEIFVFGSNLAGLHVGGAARQAIDRFGAIWGQGVGLQGQCYAIPTMQGGVETIKPYVDEFIDFAFSHSECKFLVTRIGCGIAGFTSEEIAPLFKRAIAMKHVVLPQDFVAVIQRNDKPNKQSAAKKRVFVDMDNVLVDFESGLVQVSEDLKREYAGRLDEIPGLFGLMKPMLGAIEAVHELQKQFDLFILSTAPWKNPSAWADKVRWVTRYLDDVFHKRMIITHRKDLCMGDYLIDDRGKNGTSEFAGEWIAFGSETFPDWHAVVAYLCRQI